MELVQSIGFLPVVIHTVARRLKATEELLSRFAQSYNSEPRLRGLTSYMAVVSQLTLLGAIEAVNLIRIISFFSHGIFTGTTSPRELYRSIRTSYRGQLVSIDLHRRHATKAGPRFSSCERG